MKQQTGQTPTGYPDLTWIRQALRYNWQSRVRHKVLSACIVGSEAKGRARPDSDLDIAVIIPQEGRLTALQRTERYHAKFRQDEQKPHWNGRIVDFQFFYPEDPELQGYARIALK